MSLLGFPNPVNETSARIVAGGVVTMATATVVLDKPWILAPLTYGFAARVLTGPKLSPLGQLSTRVLTPLVRDHLSKQPPKLSPGPPKRLAQGMGLAMSGTALTLTYGFRPQAGRLPGAGGPHRGSRPGSLCRLLPGLQAVRVAHQARPGPGSRLSGVRRNLVPGACRQLSLPQPAARTGKLSPSGSETDKAPVPPVNRNGRRGS